MEGNEILKLLAQSYSEATLAGSNMFRTTETLEGIRNIFNENLPDNKTDEKIGHFLGVHLKDDSLFNVIFNIQEKFRANKLENHVRTLKITLEKSPEKGWRNWLTVFAKEVSFLNYEFCEQFLKINWNIPLAHKDELKEIKLRSHFMNEAMWVDALPLMDYLVKLKFLSREVKASLERVLGQIELYHLVNRQKAKDHFDKAAKLTPNHSYTMVSFAELQIEKGNFEQAEKYMQKAMEIDKDDTLNYQLFGDFYKKKDKPETAANWYRDGLSKNLGSASIYVSLIQLNENAGYFEKHSGKIEENLSVVRRLDRNALYMATINAGYVYQKQQLYQQSEVYYKQAIKLRPDGFLGFLNLAYNYLDAKNLDASEKAFKMLLKISKETFDCYWGLAALYSAKESWENVLRNLKICLKKRPSWKAYIYNDMANAYAHLKKYSQYEKYALLALQSDNDLILGLNELYNRVNELNVNAASRLLKKISEVMPHDYAQDFHYRQGIIYYNGNDFQKALKSFTSAQKETRKTGGIDPAFILEYIGLCHERMQNIHDAEVFYLKAIEAAPQESKYFNRLGFMFSSEERYNEAITLYNRAIELLPLPMYFENRGIVYEKLEQRELARMDFEVALEKATIDQDLYENRLGIYYKNIGDLKKSAEFYNKAIATNPKAVYYDNLGITQALMGDFNAAELSYKKAIDLSPKSDQYYNRLAFFLIDQGRNEEAIDWLEGAIDLNPSPIYYENLGFAFENLNKRDKALSAYQKALKISSEGDKDIYENRLGNFYLNQQAYHKAISYYDKAIELRKNVANYHGNKAKALAALNENSSAEKSYKLAVELAENERYKHLNELGWFLCNLGRYTEAIPVFENAYKLMVDPLYLENLGYAHEALQHFDLAENYYNQALILSGSAKDRYFNRLGIFHLNRGDNDAAIDFYQKAIDINPLPVYYENLVSVAKNSGRQELFEESLLKLIEMYPKQPRYLFELGFDLALGTDKIEESIGYPTPGCLGTYCGLERDMPTLTYEIERGLSAKEIVQKHLPAILEGLKVTEKRK